MKTLLLAIFLIASCGALSAQTIKGVIKDAQNGEEIIGATVVLKDQSNRGTASGLDGSFLMNGVVKFPVKIIISFIGYKTVEIEVQNRDESLNIMLVPEATELSGVTVVGRRRQSSEVGMVAGIKSAQAVTVGVSAGLISKTSDTDAAEVVKRIPGISLLENRFIIVRGLSQRYNNVWINNGGVPSSEADGRAFSFDVIPSANIDNIVIAKSYSADLPGDFCGGFVKITTKGMPDKSSFQIGIGTGINSQTHFSDVKLGKGSTTDWLGFDLSKRPLSTTVPSNLGSIDNNSQLDHIIKTGFNNDWSVKTLKPLPDIKLNALWNSRINEKLGMTLALTYNNTYKSLDITNKRYGVYNASTNTPTVEKDYKDAQYNNDVKLNIMNNWIWEQSDKNRFEFRNLFNLIGRNRFTERHGLSTVSGEYYENQAEMLYSSRLTYTGQFAGNHTFGSDAINTIDWNTTYSYAYRDEPDRRIIKNIGNMPSDGIAKPDLPSYNDQINRYYQSLSDNIVSAGANYKRKFENSSWQPTLKAGLYGEYRDRTYTPREFIYRYDRLPYDQRNEYIYLPFEQMMSSEWLGIDKVYIDETSRKSNAYSGDYSVIAGYAAITLPIGKFNIDMGVRPEIWNMSISYDRSMSATTELMTTHKYDKVSLLPAVNVSYNFNAKHLLRLSYGRTVNRPEFREVSPAVYYDFDLFAEVQGNPDLKMATIDNLDLRYEMYPASGEMITIGAFYKKFINPIEWNFVDMGGSYRYSYENAKSAYTAGIEVDVRKSLDFIGVPQLTLVFNGALVASEVKFSDNGLVKENDRPLQGQSPYIVNTGLYYSSGEKLGLSTTLLYNIIGKRVIGVGKTTSIDGNRNFDVPDAYEMPRNLLDLTISKKLGSRCDLKLGIKDILNEAVITKQFPITTINGVDKEREQTTKSYKNGRTFSLGLTIKL